MATLTIANISKSDEGSYRCVVANKVGRDESEDAVLTIGKAYMPLHVCMFMQSVRSLLTACADCVFQLIPQAL